MPEASALTIDARTARIGLAVSAYHGEITSALRRGAEEAFRAAGGVASNLTVAAAPGSFELVAVCTAMAGMEDDSGEPAVDAIVALGCIITGETVHDQYIAQAVTHGLATLIVNTGVPIAFGVLTCASVEQARARACWPMPDSGISGVASESRHEGGGERSNKGAEAMRAALAAANTVAGLRRHAAAFTGGAGR